MTEPANILAIETATAACSVAMRIDGELVVSQRAGSNIHSKVLLQEVDQLLDKANVKVADLDAIAVGQGPGSFTGLRIGVGVAQGLAFGINRPMIGVSSLAALAKQVSSPGKILAILDARMGEVYLQKFEQRDSALTAIADADVRPPELIGAADIDHLVGNAWLEYQGRWPAELVSKIDSAEVRVPSAREVLLIAETEYEAGRFVHAAQFHPVYVRNKVAKKKGEQ